MIKHLSCILSVILIISIILTPTFAEDLIVSAVSNYESKANFNMSNDLVVKSTVFGRTAIGKLNIHGIGLTEVTEGEKLSYIVDNGNSVQFSYIDIANFVDPDISPFGWKMVDDTATKINGYSWKKRIGKGGIIVQKSFDCEQWETAYTNTNIFANYSERINNFYSATRADLVAGCYYKVIVAYKMIRNKTQSQFLFFDTSEYQATWNVEEYTFFIVADEQDIPSENPETKISRIDVAQQDGKYAGTVIGDLSAANSIAGEEIFTAQNGGHGFAAEAGNIVNNSQARIFSGEQVKHTGDNNAKNGPDYIIQPKTGPITQIQSKYYNSPSASLGACFDEAGLFRYYADNGIPMEIEVPADQYDRVVLLMQKRITEGRVPGVTDPADAAIIIRKGTITYQQAVNIAKAGNIDSLVYDAKTSCVSALSAFGISAIIKLGVSIWNHDSMDIALKKSIYTGLEVGGNAFIGAILAKQLSKAGLNSLLVPSSEAVVKLIGPKASAVIINVARVGAKPIYGAAAMKSAAKLLRSNAITGTISLVVFTVPDIYDIFRGRISGKQLLLNVAETAGGIGGGYAGAAGGASLGTMLLPGAGTVIGGIIGGIGGSIGGSMGVGAVSGLIAEDDADEMLDILTIEFQNLAEEYLLNNDEAETISAQLQSSLDTDVLKTMFASQDRHIYARDLLSPYVKTIVEQREKITVPSDDELAHEVIATLEEIYDETDEKLDSKGGENHMEESIRTLLKNALIQYGMSEAICSTNDIHKWEQCSAFETVTTRFQTDLTVRSHLIGSGRILEENSKTHTSVWLIDNGKWGSREALLVIRKKGQSIEMAVYAKDGVFSQRASDKVLASIKELLSK